MRLGVVLLVLLTSSAAACDAEGGALRRARPSSSKASERTGVATANLPIAAPVPEPDGAITSIEREVAVIGEPTLELTSARTRRLGTFHEDRYDLSGFEPTPTFYRDGNALVVRWWVEHLCDQAVRPRVERRGDVLVLRPELGPRNRCMSELSLFETRVSDPDRALHDVDLVQSGIFRSLEAIPRRPPPGRVFPPRPRRLAPGESIVLDPWAD